MKEGELRLAGGWEQVTVQGQGQEWGHGQQHLLVRCSGCSVENGLEQDKPE